MRYTYRAYIADGQSESGTVNAADNADAVRQLGAQGKLVYELRPQGEDVSKSKWEGGTRAFSIFGRDKVQLASLFSGCAVLTEAGMSVTQALRALHASEPVGAQKKVFADILSAISSGSTVRDAFFAVPGMDPATAALIASGEGRGQFATVFKELARDYTDRELKKSQLRDALAYPAFLLFLAFAAIGVVTFVLVPAIAPIFEGTEQSPPLIVRTLGQLNSWFSGTIALALAPLFGLVLVFLLLPSVRSLARDALSATTTRLPIVGPLLTKVQLARYLSSLSMLLGSGTHMVQALTLAAECHATPAQRKTLLSVLERVASGEKLPTALGQCGLFDQRIVSLIAVGDEVGRLPAVTARSAAILESEATRGINRLVATITPALTIVLGLLVGTLVVSVMTALLSVNEFALR